MVDVVRRQKLRFRHKTVRKGEEIISETRCDRMNMQKRDSTRLENATYGSCGRTVLSFRCLSRREVLCQQSKKKFLTSNRGGGRRMRRRNKTNKQSFRPLALILSPSLSLLSGNSSTSDKSLSHSCDFSSSSSFFFLLFRWLFLYSNPSFCFLIASSSAVFFFFFNSFQYLLLCCFTAGLGFIGGAG